MAVNNNPEADTLFTQDLVRDFMLSHEGGRVTNPVLVNHFKNFLNDPIRRVANRLQFKNYVNALATVKVDVTGEKVLFLKKKFKSDFLEEEQRQNEEVLPKIKHRRKQDVLKLLDSNRQSEGGPSSTEDDRRRDPDVEKEIHKSERSGSGEGGEKEGAEGKKEEEEGIIIISENVAEPVANDNEENIIEEEGFKKTMETIVVPEEIGPEESGVVPEEIGPEESVVPEQSGVVTEESGPEESGAVTEEIIVPEEIAEFGHRPKLDRKEGDVVIVKDGSSTEGLEEALKGLRMFPGYTCPPNRLDGPSTGKNPCPVGNTTLRDGFIVSINKSSATAISLVPMFNDNSSLPSSQPPVQTAKTDPGVVNRTITAANTGNTGNNQDMEGTADVIARLPPKNHVRDFAKNLDKVENDMGKLMSKSKPYMKKVTQPCAGSITDSDYDFGASNLTDLDREWILKSAACDYHAMVKMLQSHSYLAKKRDAVTGYYPIHWAVKCANLDAVKLLCGTYGADVNVKTYGGYTSLHLAAMLASQNDKKKNKKKATTMFRSYSSSSATTNNNNQKTLTDNDAKFVVVPASEGIASEYSVNRYPIGNGDGEKKMLAAEMMMDNSENLIELLVKVYRADNNVRDYSGKLAKSYLDATASSNRVQQLLVPRRVVLGGSEVNRGANNNDVIMRGSNGSSSGVRIASFHSASFMSQTGTSLLPSFFSDSNSGISASGGKENRSPSSSSCDRSPTTSTSTTKPFKHQDYSSLMPPPRHLPPVNRKKPTTTSSTTAGEPGRNSAPHSDSETSSIGGGSVGGGTPVVVAGGKGGVEGGSRGGGGLLGMAAALLKGSGSSPNFGSLV